MPREAANDRFGSEPEVLEASSLSPLFLDERTLIAADATPALGQKQTSHWQATVVQ
jgi:hypothetical protein